MYELNELTQVKQVNQRLATKYVSCDVTAAIVDTTTAGAESPLEMV